MTRASRVLLAVVLAAGFTAACNGDDEPRTTTTQTATSVPRQGGVFRIAVQRLTSLDPAQARTVDQILVADQLFDGLSGYDPETLEPVPSVAREWRASDDQQTWDFVLRPGAVFANGRTITADDVKYTLERIARQGSGSPVADLLEPVAGYRAFSIDGSAPDLTGVVVTAPDTVTITLDEPLALLPSVLANPAFGIVPREAVEAESPAFGEEPVGSGPFSFQRRRDNAISLVPADGVDTFIERLDLVEVDDAAAGYRAFRRGEVDFLAQLPPEEVEAAGTRYGDDLFRPYVAELFYGFNLASPKYADIRFREAIVRAVDQRSIIRAVYAGTVLPLDGLVVSGVPGHQDDACGERCAYDPERAEELLAEAFPDGAVPQVFLDYDDEPTQEAVARAIKANLEEVGVPVSLRAKPLGEYQAFAVSGDQELFRLGWIAAYPSPDAFLPPLFLTGYPSNLTGFSSPAVDDLLRLARAEPDGTRRLDLYQQAERAIMEQLPVLPIVQFELHAVAAERVHGLELTVLGTIDATEVWLSPAP